MEMEVEMKLEMDTVKNMEVRNMTLTEYQQLAMRTNDGENTYRLQDRIEMIDFFKDAKSGRKIEKYDMGGIVNASLGLSGEVGEVNDIIKKWIFHEKELDETHLIKELGDVMWYISLMAESFGITLEEICERNIEKLRNRYPEGFDVQRANNREKGDM